jgi:hypothetical protein
MFVLALVQPHVVSLQCSPEFRADVNGGLVSITETRCEFTPVVLCRDVSVTPVSWESILILIGRCEQLSLYPSHPNSNLKTKLNLQRSWKPEEMSWMEDAQKFCRSFVDLIRK